MKKKVQGIFFLQKFIRRKLKRDLEEQPLLSHLHFEVRHENEKNVRESLKNSFDNSGKKKSVSRSNGRNKAGPTFSDSWSSLSAVEEDDATILAY